MKKGKLLFNGSRMRNGRRNRIYINKLGAYIGSTFMFIIGILALIPPYQGEVGHVSINILLGVLAITLGIIFLILGRQFRYFMVYENGLILTQPPLFSPNIKDGFIAFDDITRIEITPHRRKDSKKAPVKRIYDMHIVGKFFNINVNGKHIPHKKYFERFLKNRVEIVMVKEYKSPYPKNFPNYPRSKSKTKRKQL